MCTLPWTALLWTFLGENSEVNYYQYFRMQKAAQLLKENRLTVSEVGYQLVFNNLGHFSRVFEQHMGIKQNNTR